MKSFVSKIFLPIIDQTMLTLSFLFFYWLSFNRELSPDKEYYPLSDYLLPCLVINIFWLLLFALFGLYGKWKNSSRFDELISIYKTITMGAIFFLIFAFWVSQEVSTSKLPILGYWASLIVLVGFGRVSIRSIQRYLLLKGIGLRLSIIVGETKLAAEMLRNIKSAPALGYDVKGFIPIEHDSHSNNIEGTKILGTVKDLNRIIEKYGITDMLIALEFKEEEEIFKLISAADSFDVDFSILPGPADVLAGRMMFNQLYGFPLIRILAEPIPPWEKNVKRIIDIVVCLIVVTLIFPLLLLIAAAIKLDSGGPVLYVQNRVGFRGQTFKLYKFRSMVADAEELSGPVWAHEDDIRITRIGRILRKTRFDEFPQIYNIIKGNMSLVGPRPERPFFVEKLKKNIPYYQLRLKIKPGLTGWAQIKHRYDRSLDDVKEKLKYDLYYIENMSLNMDFKIIIATIFVVLGRKGAH
ncbi:MAG TPA: sugar transferase [bacterium]|nr:sugar transferase [bacterium]